MGQEYTLNRILDYTIDGDSVWLITTEFPYFFLKYNFTTKEFANVKAFPDAVQKFDFPFRYLRKAGREIFFFPEDMNEIYIWGIDTEEFQILKFENGKDDFFKQKQFYPIESEKYVYFISVMAQTLIQIEKKSKKSKIIDISQGRHAEIRCAHRAYYTFLPCMYQGKVLIPMQSRVIAYDENKDEISTFIAEEIKLKSLDDGFSDYFYGVLNLKNRVVVYTYCGEVFEKEGTTLKKIEMIGTEQTVKKDGYYRPVFLDATVFEHEMVFWVNFSSHAYKLSETEKKLKKLELPGDILITGSTIKVKDSVSCMICSWRMNHVFSFDILDGHAEKYQMRFDLHSADFIRMLRLAEKLGTFLIDYPEGLFAVLSGNKKIEKKKEENTVGTAIYKSL